MAHQSAHRRTQFNSGQEVVVFAAEHLRFVTADIRGHLPTLVSPAKPLRKWQICPAPDTMVPQI